MFRDDGEMISYISPTPKMKANYRHNLLVYITTKQNFRKSISQAEPQKSKQENP